MDRICCISNCANKAVENGEIAFHRFPFHKPELLKQWITFVHKEDWQPTEEHCFICSDHFFEDSYIDRQNYVLKEDAIPMVDSISLCKPIAETLYSDGKYECEGDQENGLLCSQDTLPNSDPASESSDFSSPSSKRIKIKDNGFDINDSCILHTEDLALSSGDEFSDDSLQIGQENRECQYLLVNSVDSSNFTEDSQNYSDASDTSVTSPVIPSENITIRNFGSTEIKLNSEDDYPDGSWLGNENKPELRVRCSLNPLELAYVNTTCCTPKKMALALVNRLFQFNFQTASDFLQARKTDGWTMLDPLLMYGIQCHLISMFGINNEAWKELKWIIDSKCLSILNRHMQANTATRKIMRNEPVRPGSRNNKRVGPAQLAFLSSSSKAKVLRIDI